MPRLIRIDKTQEIELIHKHCGAVIAFFPKEIVKATNYDYGGGSETWYYIICPNGNCNKRVIEVTKKGRYMRSQAGGVGGFDYNGNRNDSGDK